MKFATSSLLLSSFSVLNALLSTTAESSLNSQQTTRGLQVQGPYEFLATNNRKYHDCTGALISTNLVIAGAHCRGRFKNGIVIGSKNLDNTSSGEIRKVAQTFVHPDYNPKTGTNDVMLLLLDEPVKNLEPVKYDSSASALETDDSLTLLGYGEVKQEFLISPKPSAEEVFAQSKEGCLDLCGEVDFDEFFCTTASTKDFWYQNSGGPLLDEDGFLVGMKALNGPCVGTQGVYTRMSTITDWLDPLLCDQSVDPPAVCGGGPGEGFSSWCSDSTTPLADWDEEMFCSDLDESSEANTLCGLIDVALKCPVTCGACDLVDAYDKDKCETLEDEPGVVTMSPRIGERDCAWLEWLLGLTYHIAFVCEDTQVALHCPKTCGTCDRLAPAEV